METDKLDSQDQVSHSQPPVESPIHEEVVLVEANKLLPTLIKKVRKQKMTLATNLEKAEDWSLEDNILTIAFSAPMYLTMVKSESPFISKLASELMGSSITVKTELIEASETAGEEKDELIELVKQVFRGQEIRRREK